MEKRKINKGLVFLYIVLLIPFLRINKLNEIIGSDRMRLYMILSSISLFVIFFVSTQKIKITKTLCFFILYQGTIAFSTVLFRGFEWGIMLTIFAAMLVFVLALVHLREIICAVSVVLIPSMVINFFSVLSATGEMNEMFFLGGKNTLGIVIIPTVSILVLNSLHKRQKISPGVIIVSALGFASVIMAGSATGIVTSVVAIAFLILFVKSTPKKFLWFGIIVFAYALFLLFSEKFFTSNIWISFVEMLGKDATLTARTRIWIAVSNLVETSMLLGFGRGMEITYTGARYFSATQFETHNVALQILLDGGIIALMFFALFLFYVIKGLDMRDVKQKVILAAIVVLLVNGLTESVANTMYTVLIFSIANTYVTSKDDTDKLTEMERVLV